jgi:hypothetical protein
VDHRGYHCFEILYLLESNFRKKTAGIRNAAETHNQGQGEPPDGQDGLFPFLGGKGGRGHKGREAIVVI